MALREGAPITGESDRVNGLAPRSCICHRPRMSRPEPWRLSPSAYPFTTDVQTRWADLDMLGHINNVAMAGLFEEGRGRFTRSLQMVRSSRDVRWLIAAVSINYLAEGHHPLPVTVASGVGRIGARSWTVYSAAFQNGACIATCDTATVYTDKTGAMPLPNDYVAKLSAFRIDIPKQPLAEIVTGAK